MQWWVWVLIAFLSIVIGYVLVGGLANLPSTIIDVIKFP
jgi:hypothetical protein